MCGALRSRAGSRMIAGTTIGHLDRVASKLEVLYEVQGQSRLSNRTHARDDTEVITLVTLRVETDFNGTVPTLAIQLEGHGPPPDLRVYHNFFLMHPGLRSPARCLDQSSVDCDLRPTGTIPARFQSRPIRLVYPALGAVDVDDKDVQQTCCKSVSSR